MPNTGPNEFNFAVGRGFVPPQVARKIDAIARKHGADFIAVKLPGEGPRYWFSAPNRGQPFDGTLAREVLADVTAAGLYLPGHRLPVEGEEPFSQRVITYRWAYVPGRITLCLMHANNGDAGGILGDVAYGDHEGVCEVCSGK